MSGIPESSLSGHKKLHDRVVGALELCIESQSIELKESCAWDNLKYKITKTTMAMANLRDGGIIIIGVAERNGNFVLEGIRVEHLETFDPDNINDFINKYASPPLGVNLVRVEHNGKEYLAIEAQMFKQSPIICKKTYEGKEKLKEGAIYIRPLGKAQTTQANKAEDIAQLLKLAAELRAAEMIGTCERIGMAPAESDPDKFEEELGGL